MDMFTPKDMEQYRSYKFGWFCDILSPVKCFLDTLASKTHDVHVRELLEDIAVTVPCKAITIDTPLQIQHTIIPILPYINRWTQEEHDWLSHVYTGMKNKATWLKSESVTHPRELLYVLGKLVTAKFPDDYILHEVWTDVQNTFGLFLEQNTEGAKEV